MRTDEADRSDRLAPPEAKALEVGLLSPPHSQRLILLAPKGMAIPVQFLGARQSVC